MKQIILDTNIVISYFIEDRPLHYQVKKFIEQNKNKIKYLITSYQYDTIFYLLKRFLKEKNITDKLNEFFESYHVNIISTTGKDNINASKYKDVEDGILISVCERVGNNCFILTSDKTLIKEFNRAISPEDFKFSEKEEIPLLDLKLEYLFYAEELENALLKAATSCNYILGEEVKELEKRVAKYIGTKYAVGVSSGTDALVLALRALAIKKKGKQFFDKDDLIITTPFTFVATGDAILRAGATPLFVDIDLETYNIDPKLIEEAVKEYGKKVVGILPVNLYGNPCNMDEIMRIAKEYELFVVEDCAQSLGAKWDGKQTGSFGDTGCFSFFPSKNLGCFGDGGMITTNDDKLYETMSILRKHGGKSKYNAEYIGYNARLDTLQAAILLEKLKHVDEFNRKRREVAQFYNENLKEIKSLVLPNINFDKAYHVYHQYTIRLKNGDREKIQKYLKQEGISTAVYYPAPLCEMKVFKGRSIVFGDCNNAKIATEKVLSLPIEPLIEKERVKKVIKSLRILNRS